MKPVMLEVSPHQTVVLHSSRINVVVIEDNPVFREGAVKIIKLARGVNIIELRGGEYAVSLFFELTRRGLKLPDNRLDLRFICDVKMPLGAEKLRKMFNLGMPVLYMTADPDSAERVGFKPGEFFLKDGDLNDHILDFVSNGKS